MQAMQYKIGLPTDYDMDIIKKRVRNNGYKTDGFQDLLFKAYLITERGTDNQENSYCPLYVWKKTEGMTKFIFGGFFDNIIDSFGWQNIEVGVTSSLSLSPSFSKSKYVIEEYHNIYKQPSLENMTFKAEDFKNILGQVTIYNPDKWKYVNFYFFEQKPEIFKENQKLYSILHLSLEK
ncbi:DUF4865 family protein (plasmid) [Latilactobacillus sp. 5-91]|uniref:DUF4865 family protein n=1 Tax=Latilactobacillus TaxID=2767885 RepID=UPI0020305102|nr:MULTISPECIES: DUF4865 family protein [Latilactobacillus]MCM1636686.1 DUF4865 family protein [Latilactobacillus sakei]MCW8780806.1 DUF4865 family protein [Latilactobacillus curvatus]